MSGWKQWQQLEVVTQSDLQNYIQDQVVQVYANSAARSTALGANATVGMVSYLQDTQRLEVRTLLGWQAIANDAPISPNYIINGAFDFNQRGFTSVTTDNAYTFDRWVLRVGGDGTVTATPQTFAPGAAPVAGYEGTNFIQIVTASQTTTAVQATLTQRIEDVRTLANQNITVSFWARATSGTPNISVEFQQNFGSGGSATVSGIGDTFGPTLIPISTTWTRYTTNIAVPSISGKTIGASSFLSANFWISAGSSFSSRTGGLGIQNNTFQIWGIQVEAGRQSTPFRRNANSLQAELAACQRYYWRSNADTNVFGVHGMGTASSTTNARIMIKTPVTMRNSSGTSIEFGNLNISDWVTGFAVSAVTLVGAANTRDNFVVDATTSSLTQYRTYWLNNNNNSSGFIAINAEL